MIKTINFIFEINDKYYRIDGFNLFKLTVYLEQINYLTIFDIKGFGCIENLQEYLKADECEVKLSTNEIEYTEDYRGINLINLFIRFLKALWAYFQVDRKLKTTKELLEEEFNFFEENF